MAGGRMRRRSNQGSEQTPGPERTGGLRRETDRFRRVSGEGESRLSEAVYRPSDTLFTCTARNLEYILTDVGEAVGLKQGLLSFENLRWISALQDWENDVEKDDIRQKLGLSKVTWRETKTKLTKLAVEREKQKPRPL